MHVLVFCIWYNCKCRYSVKYGIVVCLCRSHVFVCMCWYCICICMCTYLVSVFVCMWRYWYVFVCCMFVLVSRCCMYVRVLYLYVTGLPYLYVCGGILIVFVGLLYLYYVRVFVFVFVCVRNWYPVFVCMWRYWGTRPILHGVELERSLRWPVTDGII